jgi:hypothetical protein
MRTDARWRCRRMGSAWGVAAQATLSATRRQGPENGADQDRSRGLQVSMKILCEPPQTGGSDGHEMGSLSVPTRMAQGSRRPAAHAHSKLPRLCWRSACCVRTAAWRIQCARFAITENCSQYAQYAEMLLTSRSRGGRHANARVHALVSVRCT